MLKTDGFSFEQLLLAVIVANVHEVWKLRLTSVRHVHVRRKTDWYIDREFMADGQSVVVRYGVNKLGHPFAYVLGLHAS